MKLYKYKFISPPPIFVTSGKQKLQMQLFISPPETANETIFISPPPILLTSCLEQAETTNAIDKRCHAKLVGFDFRLNHNQDNDKCHHEEVDSTPSLTNLSTPWLNNTMTNLPPNMSLWPGFGDRSISMRNALKQWPIHGCLVWHYDGDDDIQGDTSGLISGSWVK